tara:strand:- start:1269 stop:2444 length:1176 start_codon:yes stop_codon:yes gene_type:complete
MPSILSYASSLATSIGKKVTQVAGATSDVARRAGRRVGGELGEEIAEEVVERTLKAGPGTQARRLDQATAQNYNNSVADSQGLSNPSGSAQIDNYQRQQDKNAPPTPFQAYNRGVNNSHIYEPNPTLNAGEDEQVMSKGMSFITLGRDRPTDLNSGYGGAGHSHASAIDLVAGLGGIFGRDVDDQGEQVFTNKNPFVDSARIYMSQRTDIDRNFGLVEGSDPNLETRSGIAMKADGVRIIGREGIKLVTSTDTFNSQGIPVAGQVAGIDLIAGNNISVNKLEPLVKGDQLTRSLQELGELLRDLNSNCKGLLINIIDLHKDFAFHIHVNAGGPTTPPNGGASLVSLAADVIFYGMDYMEMYNYDKNVKAWELNNLNPNGDGYINSGFNNTN